MPKTHGYAGGAVSRTYRAWKGMLQRCKQPTRADWPRYGGRGIRVCERWRLFTNFLADMGPCPDGLTLDRIDNCGNYEPGNCRWTTWEVQYGNRRSNRGELHGNAKLTVGEVRVIRLLARRGVSHRRLGAVFGVSHTNVGYIVHKQAWRHLVRATDATCRQTEL